MANLEEERFRHLMSQDFMPDANLATNADLRIARAVEDMAFHIGRISRRLGAVIEKQWGKSAGD